MGRAHPRVSQKTVPAMAELTTSRVWMMRSGYLALMAAIIFFHLLPLNTQPRQWAPPDLILAFTFAWALRRPDFVPALSVAAVMLVADLLFQRPPGLLAVCVVIGCEYLKTQFGGLTDASFAGEWASVAIVAAAIMAANRIILAIVAVDQAPFLLAVIQLVLTIAVYPIVVWVTHALLGVRKLTPSDADVLGNRA